MRQYEEIEKLLRKVSSCIKEKGREVLKYSDITPPQFDLMVKLYFKGEMDQTVLSKELYLAKSTVSGILERLEKRSFVKRVKVKEDRRRSRVSLTPKGVSIIERVIDERVKYIEKITSNLDREKLDEFIYILREIEKGL
ncbi:MAG: MarR family transcriptional regulator [Candidatus Hydrothermota bacterium]|nr:MAG: MarR family transcriptional regulator [Candidatus Hydrothermae bacterium]